jgi:hypothetical protein
MKYPFADTKKFPLAQYPYKSRLHTQLTANKGYSFVSFQPGFPLQAQELNEIQEISYVQSTLNQTMTNFWCNSKIFNSSVNPSSVVYGPGWDGCTPLIPETVGNITPNIQINGTEPYTITTGPGWYLLRSALNTSANILGGLGVWVYYPNTVTLSGFTRSISTTKTVYAIATIYAVKCVNSEDETTIEDPGLRDFSSFNTVNGPCGANRYAVKINNFSTSNSTAPGEQAFAVMDAVSNGTSINFTYKNNYIVKSG